MWNDHDWDIWPEDIFAVGRLPPVFPQQCRNCGKPIELRGPCAGEYKPYDRGTTVLHQCDFDGEFPVEG